MKRVYVLGPRGMLGEMVVKYFSGRPNFQVLPVEDRFSLDNLADYFRRYDNEKPAIFINGIGAIPQKVTEAEGFILPNILLPLELARSLAPHHQLIHPSTDCVFSGDRGEPYSSTDEPNATDAYGWSKVLAERALVARPNTVVIRTSIIGPSSGASAGLLQWFLAQPTGASLLGFTDHMWNGMTTKQWCVEVENLISEQTSAVSGLLQCGWEGGCSKYEMLKLFASAYRPDITVAPVKQGLSVDRRLTPDILVPSLKEQLAGLSSKEVFL